MSSLFKLQTAMALTMTALFGFMIAVFGVIALLYGPRGSVVGTLIIAIVLAVIGTGIQWLIGPTLIKWTTRMRELEPKEYGWIHEFVEKTARQAGIQKPKLYLVSDGTPNAFAFGRTPNNSNIAIHAGLLNILNKNEVEAVLAHEIGHVKHWDVAVITLASIIPQVIYYAIVMFFTPRDENGNVSIIGWILTIIGAQLTAFIANLLVMYLSRTRESYADVFSAVTTKQPGHLRTALAKIAYGFPALNSTAEYSTRRAFYIADPIVGSEMAHKLHSKDLANELEQSEAKRRADPIQIDTQKEINKAMEWEKQRGGFLELFSTHPMAYKRIDALYEIEKDLKAGRIKTA